MLELGSKSTVLEKKPARSTLPEPSTARPWISAFEPGVPWVATAQRKVPLALTRAANASKTPDAVSVVEPNVAESWNEPAITAPPAPSRARAYAWSLSEVVPATTSTQSTLPEGSSLVR